MSIWEAFGMGRHKGFSREAGLLLDEAVELAGSMGCARADTGHLLLAMLQTDRGPAGRFLAGKNITEPAVRRQLAEGRTSPARQLDRKALAPDLRRAMDYAHRAQNAHLPKRSRSTCSAPCWRIPTARRGCCWLHGGAAGRGRAGVPPALRGSSSCPARPGPAPCPGAAAPAISIAAT